MNVLRGASLMAATMSMGFVAAVFVFYSNTIMPGLRDTDDRTFVAAFRSIDEAITNPLFLGFGFLGALLLTGLAGALHLRAGQRSSLPWIAAAFLLYLVAFVVTIAVNVPLNNALEAAGDPDQIADLTTVRNQFDESRWVAWNNARSAVSVVGFGCLTWALVQYGRSSAVRTRVEHPATPWLQQ
jgi:uncharacterized membrane protein